MFEEILVTQNPHWNGQSYNEGSKRTCFSKLLSYLETGQIIAITGVLGAGKTTLIKQLINHLIHISHIQPQNILFFNLEHPYLSAYREEAVALQRIYEDYLKIMQPEGMLYIFLDEVQFFRKWPLFVKALHETKKAQFVITGSNAAMLSSDMITLLSGRSLALEVFPFSLKELALNKKIPIQNPAAIAQKATEIKHLLDGLLEYGGFPTVALKLSHETAFDILGSHAKTVLLQDVAPRLGIRKPIDLEKLYVYLVSNISALFSYTNLSKLFSLSDKSIKEYVQALNDAYLVCEVDLFSYSLKQQIRSQKKIYAIDTGQAIAMGFKFSANRGHLLENLILLELKRLSLQIYYYKSRTGYEVDFVATDKGKIALIQVAWDINPIETYQREVRALKESMQELHCQTALILVAEPQLSPPPLEEGITILAAYQFLMLDPEKQRKYLFP
jgi:predicted AAA+ superfamily ATPase